MQRAPIAAIAATLGCGLIINGCSGSSRTTYVNQTSAPVTSGTSGTTSSTTPGAAAGLPQAPASQGNGLDAFNQELQVVWDDLRPMVLTQLTNLATQQLAGQHYTSSAVDLEVVNVRMGPLTQMAVAPGLTRADPTSGITLRAPLTGTWTVALDLDVRVRVKLGGFQPAIDLPLTLLLDDLTLEAAIDLDGSDPTRPVVTRVGQPQLNFTVKIDSSSSLVQNLTNVLNQPANWLAQTAAQVALGSLAPTLNGLAGMPGPVPGAGAAHLVDNGVATPFDEVARNIELKTRLVNMPHGTLLSAIMDTPQTDSWLDAYRNGGSGNQGAVVGYGSGGDSAIFTGMYLAGEAFRFAATGDPLAMDQIGHTLGGIAALLDVNGGTGLLARCAAPENSLVGANIMRKGPFRQRQYRGENWVTEQGSNGISRDQYSGIFFGLSICYELVPAARPQCELYLQMMLDYLIANDWIVDEDRPAFTGQAGSSRGPTFWAGNTNQKITFLLMGHRMDPAKYANRVALAGPLTETAWLGSWTGTFGFDHYYKYNLSHMAYYNFFRLETDMGRWQNMHRAYAITERYIGHHHNPHFNLVETTIDPHTSVDNFPASKQALRDFLDRNHREVADAVVDLSNVTFVPYTAFGYSNGSSGSVTVGSSQTTIPSEPLPITLRKPTGHFLWQRDPFSPATPNQGNPRSEKPSLDFTLPYWMGRFYNAW